MSERVLERKGFRLLTQHAVSEDVMPDLGTQ
jgi:hypothetical protein